MAISPDQILRDWDPRYSQESLSSLVSRLKSEAIKARNEASGPALSYPTRYEELLLAAETPYWMTIMRAYERWLTHYDPYSPAFKFAVQTGLKAQIEAQYAADAAIFQGKETQYQAIQRARQSEAEAERQRQEAQRQAEAERQRRTEEEERRIVSAAEERRRQAEAEQVIRTAEAEQKKRFAEEEKARKKAANLAETQRREAIRLEWLRAAKERSRITTERKAKEKEAKEAAKVAKAAEKARQAVEVQRLKDIKQLSRKRRQEVTAVAKNLRGEVKKIKYDLHGKLRAAGLPVREVKQKLQEYIAPIEKEVLGPHGALDDIAKVPDAKRVVKNIRRIEMHLELLQEKKEHEMEIAKGAIAAAIMVAFTAIMFRMQHIQWLKELAETEGQGWGQWM